MALSEAMFSLKRENIKVSVKSEISFISDITFKEITANFRNIKLEHIGT